MLGGSGCCEPLSQRLAPSVVCWACVRTKDVAVHCWLACCAFFVPVGAMLPLGGTSYSSAVEALGRQLSDSCGCFSSTGTSALGHAKRSLLTRATGAAKRQLTLLKGLQGVRVAVVPFHELLQEQSCALEYVQAVLREQGVV